MHGDARSSPNSSTECQRRTSDWFTRATCDGPRQLEGQLPRHLVSTAVCGLHFVRSILVNGKVLPGQRLNGAMKRMHAAGLQNIRSSRHRTVKTSLTLSGEYWTK